MLTLAKEELKSNQESKVCCNYESKSCNYTDKYRGAHSIRNLKFNVGNEIPKILNKGLNYDYYVIIKELAHEFEG